MSTHFQLNGATINRMDMATCYPSQFTILSLHQQSTEPKNIFDFCPTGTFQSKLGNMKFTLIAILAVVGVVIALPAGKKQDYPLKLQPELDVVNIDDYLRNERLLDLQIKCVLEKAPCDTVGRWVKPRVAAALTGTCLMCTEKQKVAMQKVLEHIQEKRPEAYRESVVKYLKDSGIDVPQQSTPKSS